MFNSAKEYAPHTRLGLALSASEYCIEQGTKLEIKNESYAQVGHCHLKDGQVIQDWQLFKASLK